MHNINKTSQRAHESGNILIIILITLALLAALTYAVQGSNSGGSHIDKETLQIRTTEVQRYASELERGIQYIMQNGVSEADIRFAHVNAHSDYGDLSADSDKSDQMFHRDGGGAHFRDAPSGINNGDPWEFYGDTAAPDVGSDAADLIVVLPNVTQAFCERINAVVGLEGQPTDTVTCINGGAASRFNNTTQFSGSPNNLQENSFSHTPAPQACVQCADDSYHFYHVIMAR